MKGLGRIVGSGVVMAALGLLAGACGSDDDKMYKWSCSCGNACAATQAEAVKVAVCGSGDIAVCMATGDSCVCPGGAKSCAIAK